MPPIVRVFFIIFLILLLIMPIYMTYTGVKNLMECPIQPKIPIYLFVGGSVGLVKLLQTIYDQWRIRKKEKFDQGDLVDLDGFDGGGGGESGSYTSSKFVDNVMTLFLIIWFVFGNYWVFSIWQPKFVQPLGPGSMKWCSKDAYMIAVYQIISVYILTVTFFIIIIILFIFSKLRKFNENSENQDGNNNTAMAV